MQQDVQTGATCNIQQRWELLANNAKMASIVKRVYKANLYMNISGINSSNGGITNPKCGDGHRVPGGKGASFFCRPSLYGRYVTIRIHERTTELNFCEVEVYSARRGTEPSGISVMHYALVFTYDGTKILFVVYSSFFFSVFDSCKRLPPVSDYSVFVFWMVAYGRFDCN